MAEDGKKVAIGVGLALAATGVILLATRAEAKPPEEPEPGLATVYGIVTRADTDNPLGGVSVSLWSPDETELLATTTTNGAGSYSLANILPGSYKIYFQKDGFETAVY